MSPKDGEMGLWDIVSNPAVIAFVVAIAAFCRYQREREVVRWFSKEDVAVLRSKLPQEGSLAPTDWGSEVGANVKMTRTSVKQLGKLCARKQLHDTAARLV